MGVGVCVCVSRQECLERNVSSSTCSECQSTTWTYVLAIKTVSHEKRGKHSPSANTNINYWWETLSRCLRLLSATEKHAGAQFMHMKCVTNVFVSSPPSSSSSFFHVSLSLCESKSTMEHTKKKEGARWRENEWVIERERIRFRAIFKWQTENLCAKCVQGMLRLCTHAATHTHSRIIIWLHVLSLFSNGCAPECGQSRNSILSMGQRAQIASKFVSRENGSHLRYG